MLPYFIPSVLTLLFCKSLYAAECPLLGPIFPPPRGLSSISTWKKAIAEFESNLKNLLSHPSGLNANSTSFSINIFSAYEDSLLYTYYHDAPGLKGSIAKGQKLNGDTMYRIASVSKVITVYTLLIEAGFGKLDEPVARFVPEIVEAIKTNGDSPDATLFPQWRDITLGSLAGQLSGLGRGKVSTYFNDLALNFNQSEATQLGFPPLSDSERPTCGFKGFVYKPCSRREMFEEFINRDPVFAPFSTPIYSNPAYDILGYAIEGITKVSFEESVKRSLIDPLKLKRFGVKMPPTSWGIIPFDTVSAEWNASLDSSNPAAGFYSSANDLALVGQSILQSRLISPADTRRWLKPNSHTSDFRISVGSPWEILRTSHPRTIDFYTKTGDLNKYGSILGLSPDHDVGFTILTAGANPGTQRSLLTDLIIDLLRDALDEAARIRAVADYAGTYSSSTGTENKNATVLEIRGNRKGEIPGLIIDSMSVNGVPLEVHFSSLFRRTEPISKIGLRLQPTGLKAKYTDSSCKSVKSRTSFRVLLDIPNTVAINNVTADSVFSGVCGSWASVDGVAYGRVSIDEVVFELDEMDNAVALELRIAKQTLLRQESSRS
ncbi:hypothetical protein PABG_05138 [Paracoccidioides brasiliensis Pb03]|nr:hypothetical protein PABG_05138 [Paracoccidioides brasiliensis Pb03]